MPVLLGNVRRWHSGQQRSHTGFVEESGAVVNGPQRHPSFRASLLGLLPAGVTPFTSSMSP
jgi:hypothetical protein